MAHPNSSTSGRADSAGLLSPPSNQFSATVTPSTSFSSTSTLAFPMQTTPLASIAARKAALFEKIGASANSPATTNDTSAVNPVYLTPSFTQPDWARLIAERRDRKDTGLSVATTSTAFSGNQPTPARLTPMPTGSTMVSATADLGLGHPSLPNHAPHTMDITARRRSSAGSKVKMAVMALNAMDKARQTEGGPTWRVGAAPSPADRDSRPGTSMRSWSRMSGATTALGDLDLQRPLDTDPENGCRDHLYDPEPKALGPEGNLEDRMEVDEISTPVYTAPYPDLAVDTNLATSLATYSLESIKDVEEESAEADDPKTAGIWDENFDTHPPNMVSPRTGLAYVILPPWARARPNDGQPTLIKPSQIRSSRMGAKIAAQEPSEISISEAPRYERGVDSNAVIGALPPSDLNQAASTSTPPISLSPDPIPEVNSEPDDRNGIPEASSPISPCVSPVASPPPAQLSRSANAPIVLRGQGKSTPIHAKRHASTMHGSRSSTMNHIRTFSVSYSPTPSLTRIRRSAMTPAPLRPHHVGMQPTKFWQAPERFRRPDSVLSVSLPQWENPVEVKAQNKIPLRKVQTPGSSVKAMRF